MQSNDTSNNIEIKPCFGVVGCIVIDVAFSVATLVESIGVGVAIIGKVVLCVPVLRGVLTVAPVVGTVENEDFLIFGVF